MKNEDQVDLNKARLPIGRKKNGRGRRPELEVRTPANGYLLVSSRTIVSSIAAAMRRSHFGHGSRPRYCSNHP